MTKEDWILIRWNKSIFLAFLLLGIQGLAQAAPKKFANVQQALQAADKASSKDEERSALDDAAKQPIQTREDLRSLFDSVKEAQRRVEKGGNMGEARDRLKRLAPALSQAKLKMHHSALAELISEEISALPPQLKTEPEDDDRLNLQVSRLAILMQMAGEGKNKAALPSLRALSKRPDMIGQMAIKTIGQIADPADLERIVGEIKRNPKLPADLSGFGATLLDRIMLDVNNPAISTDEKNALIARIGQAAGPDSVSKLRALVKHENKKVVEEAALALKNSLSPSDEGVVLEMIGNESADVRFSGVSALDQKMWSPKHAQILMSLLKNDPDEDVRSQAANILGKRKIGAAESALKAASKDGSSLVRSAAEGALKNLSGENDKRIQQYIQQIRNKK